jgi:tRNA 2-thiouridine synthesizing protein E
MGGAGLPVRAGFELEMSGMLELPDGRRVALDVHGHLCRREDWSREVAVAMAAADGLELGAGHWLVMDVLTAYYEAYGVETPMRLLVRKLHERGAPELASSRALYRLFPEGPARQGSRYAGLPIPVSCI